MERRGHTARTHRCAQRRVTCDTRLKPQGPALNLFHQGLAGQPPLPIGTVDGGFVTAAALQALGGRLEEAAARSQAWQSSLHPKLSVHSESVYGTHIWALGREGQCGTCCCHSVFFLAVLGPHCFLCLLFPSCGMHTSHGRGFSCCGAQAVGAWAHCLPCTDSRGFSSCDSWALEHRLNSYGSQAF